MASIERKAVASSQRKNDKRKHLTVVSLGSGVPPAAALSFLPFYSDLLRRQRRLKFHAIEKRDKKGEEYETSYVEVKHPRTGKKVKLRINYLWYDNFKFLKEAEKESIDVINILMPIDLFGIQLFDLPPRAVLSILAKKKKPEFNLIYAFWQSYFKHLNRVLKPNGRIIFLSESKPVAEAIKSFFQRKGYKLFESNELAKKIIARSDFASQHYSNSIIKPFAFILMKPAKKSIQKN